jgi:hypothetical protein
MEVLIYVGGVIIALWGIGHLFPTKGIVNGFGKLSDDNHHIITMEWLAEGFTLIFIGILCIIIASVSDSGDKVANAVYLTSAMMLVAMAILSFFTGFKTSITPIKACPFVKLIVMSLLVLGVML